MAKNILLRAKEASDRMAIHVMHLYKIAREGEIERIKIGRRGIRFRESDVERWIKKKLNGHIKRNKENGC